MDFGTILHKSTLLSCLQSITTGDGTSTDVNPVENPCVWRKDLALELFNKTDTSASNYGSVHLPSLHMDGELDVSVPTIDPSSAAWFSPSEIRHFHEKGFVVASSVFLDDAIAIFKKELELYDQSASFTGDRSGWVRNGWGTPAQVIATTDPVLLGMYCQLRGVSSVQVGLHESKLQRSATGSSRSSGEFSHVDINLFKAFMLQRDENVMFSPLHRIQMVVCLTDQKDEEGFKVVPGFHKKWFNWIQELHLNEAKLQSLASLPSALNLEKFKPLDFVPVHAAKGSVIFFSSALPHGCTSVTSATPRLAMFPCMLARSSDVSHKLLDHDMDSVEEEKYHKEIADSIKSGKPPRIYANGKKIGESKRVQYSSSSVQHVQVSLDILQEAMLTTPELWNHVRVKELLGTLLGPNRVHARTLAMKIRKHRMIGLTHSMNCLVEYSNSENPCGYA